MKEVVAVEILKSRRGLSQLARPGIRLAVSMRQVFQPALVLMDCRASSMRSASMQIDNCGKD